MRSFLAVVVLSACAPHASTGPDWPKQHAAATDGGESLAPHESRAVEVAVEKVEPETKPVVAEVKTTPAPVPAAVPAAAPAAAAPATEEPMTIEDIVIEIDSD